MQPTILTNINSANHAYREEFFGPVALFFRVKNEDEGVALANDSDFGLGASVFTQDVLRSQRVPSRLDTGMVLINHRRGLPRISPSAASSTPATAATSPAYSSRNSLPNKMVRTTSINAPV
jgi:succinate-semialdehyde dehydrogenase / glutarate-semialdehyde dehydrogenase